MRTPPAARVPATLVLALSLAVPVAVAPPVLAQAAPGARLVAGFGAAQFHGSPEPAALSRPLVAMAPTPSGGGYRLAAADGGVFAYGDAAFHGSAGALRLRSPVVGMAGTPSGNGYWLVAGDGGVFAFGDAVFRGSTGNLRLVRPVVGMAATPSGDGYWLAAADGGVFSFGDAAFQGSTGALRLQSPVVGMAATPSGGGYWLAAADGGVFAFGDATFHGSAAALRMNRPVVGMAATPTGGGYWLVGGDGAVFAFGDAVFHGAAGAALPVPVTGMAVAPGGAGYWMVSGSGPLAPGSLGASVEALQRRLLELGYWVVVDGRYGELTRQAVYALEKAAGLPRRGIVGPEERKALEAGVRPVPRNTSGSAIEVDKARQLLLVVREGRVQWIFNTSTGNNQPYVEAGERGVAITPEGRFRIYRVIDGERRSTLGLLVRPRYFTGGYAVHGSPSVPPFPASHGCVRLTNAAMDFVWSADLMPIGMPLHVYS